MKNKTDFIKIVSRLLCIATCVLISLQASAKTSDNTPGSNDLKNDSLITAGWHSLNTQQIKKAFEYTTAALDKAKATENINQLKSCYELLQAISVAKKDYKNAREYFTMYIVYRDSLLREENTRKKVQSEMQYEFDKKQEARKLLQDKINLQQATQTRHQNILLIIIIAGTIIVIVFSVFLFKRFRLITRQKNIIQSQKEEVETQKIISDERRLLAEKQGEIIHEKQKEILDSIRYAKRIQNAL
ncbi:MAG: hypothetical protein ACXVNO_07635, partial [Bacteroidia bacterium]